MKTVTTEPRTRFLSTISCNYRTSSACYATSEPVNSLIGKPLLKSMLQQSLDCRLKGLQHACYMGAGCPTHPNPVCIITAYMNTPLPSKAGALRSNVIRPGHT